MQDRGRNLEIKYISQLTNHQTILKNIARGDAVNLVDSLFQAHMAFENTLQLIDEQSGKSLLTIVQESSIDINKAEEIDYGDFYKTFTPLESLFFRQLYIDINSILIRLKLVLSLGANVNQRLNENGDTVLHLYAAKMPIPVLCELIKAGGDVNQQNSSGKTSLALMDESTATYIRNFQLKLDENHCRAVKLQRLWRLRGKSTTGSCALIHESLSVYAPQPERTSCLNTEKVKEWINKHHEADQKTATEVVNSIQHISYEHFLFGLKRAVKKFNRYLMSLPVDKRNYVLHVDFRRDKSGPWVTKLAEKYLAIAPTIIIDSKTFASSFDPKNDVHHIVFFDDASYSGNLLCGTFTTHFHRLITNNKKLANLQYHLIVPFISEKARERLRKFDVILHSQEVIRKFNVPGTKYIGETATYFDHKIPVDLSAIECLENGKLITGEDSGILLVDPIVPPYKPANR